MQNRMWVLCFSVLLAACGGGGGKTGETTPAAAPVAPAAAAPEDELGAQSGEELCGMVERCAQMIFMEENPDPAAVVRLRKACDERWAVLTPEQRTEGLSCANSTGSCDGVPDCIELDVAAITEAE